MREYSSHEKTVWTNRPLTCHCFAAAVEHHHQQDPERQQQRDEIDFLKGNAKRRRGWETIPEWCHREEHPLFTGRPGRLYHKSDCITPIVDSMQRMVDCKGGSDALNLFTDVDAQNKKRRKQDAYDETDAEASEKARRERERVAREVGTAINWVCACCGNTDIKTQVQHKDALLCPCGFVVRLGSVVSTHREKLGAEEGEDKTQHADKPREQRVHWSDTDYVPSVVDRRNERKFASQVAKIGGRVKGLGRLCDAQRVTESAAAKEQLADDVRNGFKLTPKDETKGWNIIAQINELSRQLAPIDHEVKRTLRCDANGVWSNAVRHCRSCTRTDCCELRLIERTPAIIAASVFETTIERLLHDESNDVRVSRQHLLDIQLRMQRSSTFTNTPAITQMNTAKAMIHILQAPDFDPSMVCAPTLPKSSASCSLAAAEATKGRTPLSSRMPFARNDSSISADGASPTPTDAVLMRDAVSTVFLAHRSELPVAVRDGAMRALQSPGFVKAVNEIESLRPYSIQCYAFCILNAVHREQKSAEPGPSFATTSEPDRAFDVGIAIKLNFDLAIAEESIVRIRALVPTDAASEASTGEDDDLFS